MKQCTKCLTTKTITCFSLCTAKTDGRTPHCRQCVADYNKNYYKDNTDKVKTAAREYEKHNLEKVKQSRAAWRKENMGIHNSRSALGRARRNQRTPKWLTSLDLDHIQMFYEAAKALTKETGIKFVVDHIVPLNGKEVCGLHVPWNLQILTQFDNGSKGNKI